jgi:hypothetical protein
MLVESTTLNVGERVRGSSEPADSRDICGLGSDAIVKGRVVGSAGLLQKHRACVSVWTDRLIIRGNNYFNVDEARAAAERLAGARM